MHERNVGGLWCHEVLEQLDTFVDGGLDVSTLAAVRVHLASCDACSAFGDAYARMVRALRSVEDEELDAKRLDRIRRKVRDAL